MPTLINSEFNFKPSKQYLTLCCLTLLIGLVVLIYLPLNIELIIPISASLLIYQAWLIWRFGLLRGQHAILSLRRLSTGQWLVNTSQTSYQAVLRGDSTITSWVLVLRFQLPACYLSKSCIIFRDSLPADQYRRLLVILLENTLLSL